MRKRPLEERDAFRVCQAAFASAGACLRPMREWIFVTASQTSPGAFDRISVRFVHHFNDRMTTEAHCRLAVDVFL
jgi:hypothetical protein